MTRAFTDLIACHKRLIGVVMIVLGLCGCSSDQRYQRQWGQVKGPSDQEIARVLKQTLDADQRLWTRAATLRQGLDKEGRSTTCPHGKMIANPGYLAWLTAWCAHRQYRDKDVIASASQALRFFGERGDLRRQSELYGLMALSYARVENQLMAQVYGQKARRLILDGRLPLTGGVADVYAGDLPYILGQLAVHGVVAHTTPTRVKGDWASLFLSTAVEEYKSTQRPHAQTHALRARARYALIQGRLNDANRDLHEALAIALKHQNNSGIYETAIDVADLALAQNQTGFARQVEDWLMVKKGPTYLPIPARLRDFPTQSAEMGTMLRQTQGRRSLLEYVRRIRRTPSLALNPPAHMLRVLTQFKDSSYFKGSGWRLAYEMGQLLHERGLTEHARRYFTWAIESAEQLRRQLPDPRQRQRFFADKRELYLDLIHSHVGIETANLTQGDYLRALQLTSALKARGLMDLMHQKTSPGTVTRALPSLSESSTPKVAGVSMTSALKQWQGEQNALPAALSSMTRAKLPVLANKKTMLVEFVLGKRAGYVWVIHNKKIVMRRITGKRALKPLVEAFRKTLVMKRFTPAQAKTHRKQAERLFVALFGPIQDLISKADHLIIAPDALLHDVPFEALAKPSKTALTQTPHYIIKDVSVSYVPSTLVLNELLTRHKAPKKATKRAFILGNPSLKPRAMQLLRVSPGLAAKTLPSFSTLFPPMPGSQQEVEAITSTLKTSSMRIETLTGQKATEGVLRKTDFRNYDLIHLSTHGLSDAATWQNKRALMHVTQPTLLLGVAKDSKYDGLVQLDEILSMRTSARLVVLSGCTTGRGWRSLGDGAYGLAGAFLSTGSQAVVASMWDVADLATSRLMRLFYNGLSQKQDAALALRRAQLRMIRYRTAANRTYLPPYYWASFRLIGLSSRAKL